MTYSDDEDDITEDIDDFGNEEAEEDFDLNDL